MEIMSFGHLKKFKHEIVKLNRYIKINILEKSKNKKKKRNILKINIEIRYLMD